MKQPAKQPTYKHLGQSDKFKKYFGKKIYVFMQTKDAPIDYDPATVNSWHEYSIHDQYTV